MLFHLDSRSFSQPNKQKINSITLSNYANHVHFHFLTRHKHLEGRDYALLIPVLSPE